VLSLTALVIGLSVILMLSYTRPGAAAPQAAPTPLSLSLIPFVTSGLTEPLSLANAGDERLFVVEKDGRIKIVAPTGNVVVPPFLDINGRVDSSDSEEGLLGLAFHPNYEDNGFFYVNYTHTPAGGSRRTRISRFSEEILLTVNQPAQNHNAGDIHFGPDGYLYIPLGDGGGSGYFNANAQSTTLLLGKIVRIDVDASLSGAAPDCQGSGSGSYTIPGSNPFIDGPGGACDEIWAENYGWNCYEASTPNPDTTSSCQPISYTLPIFEYNQSGNGCSITGGYVYRGSNYAIMYGRYLLADYCTGNFWDLARDGNSWIATKHTNLTRFGYVAFGQDQHGELYVANINNNTIYRLVEFSPTQNYFLPLILKQS
jgi:hypothetical protein